MFVEIQKLVISKSLISFLVIALGGFIKQYHEEAQDEAPGDNFPSAVMYR